MTIVKGEIVPIRRSSSALLTGALALTLSAGCGSKQDDPSTVPSAEGAATSEESWQETQASEPEPTQAPTESEPAPASAATPGEPTGGGESVSENDVESFARAYLQVMAIQQDFGPKLQNASSQEEAKSLQTEAQEAMASAIETEGMTTDEFEALGQSLNTDEELRQRVETKLQELQTSAPPQ